MIPFQKCAAEWCERSAEEWRFSQRVKGLVPACPAHDLDVAAGGTKLKDDTPVLERGVTQ